ncbi:MAG: pilus assembly protein PilM, partial [Candidatus Omnitrophica bacterium]|nr:pilus assembly protein PilM [Candidatus Omnitrophota bacterium]
MAQPVSDIKKVLSVSDVLHAHPKEQVGIDLGGNHLKFARVIIHANKRELVNIAHRDVTGMSEEDISKAVKTAIEDMKANDPEVVVTIPAHLVITKNIEIPSTDPREIMAIVNLQASRHTPYSREEIIVDYIHVGTYKQTYSRILLLIASREVI